MKLYGPNISYSMIGSPGITGVTGIAENFSYEDSIQVQDGLVDGDIGYTIEHGEKGAISFEVSPPANITALPARAGATLAIDGITTGKIICQSVTAKWQRGQKMQIDVKAMHYPYLSDTTSGSLQAGSITLSGGTGGLVLPNGKIWWSTEGITPVVDGIVQSFSLSESVQLQEEEGSGENVGKIVAVIIHSYKGKGSMEVLTGGEPPAKGATMTAFGGFRVEKSNKKFTQGALRNIVVEGYMIPSVTE